VLNVAIAEFDWSVTLHPHPIELYSIAFYAPISIFNWSVKRSDSGVWLECHSTPTFR